MMDCLKCAICYASVCYANDCGVMNCPHKNVTKEHNMTREEAIGKLAVLKPQATDSSREFFVDYAQALGLIKFDQPVKKELSAAQFIDYYTNRMGSTIVQNLEAAGYRIVKLGKNTTVKMDSSVLVEYNKFNGKLVEIEQ